jgi:hypothetical protein
MMGRDAIRTVGVVAPVLMLGLHAASPAWAQAGGASATRPVKEAATRRADRQKTRPLEYGDAAAHNPCFDRKDLWPENVREAGYCKQAWKPARLLVWTRKGKYSGSVNDLSNWRAYPPSADASDPKAGKPAESAADGNTDVLLPGSAEGTELEVGGVLKARHVTVGPKVKLTFQTNPGLHVAGNLWVQEKADLWIRSPHFVGEGHVFARNERGNKRVMHKMPQFNKGGGGSVELLGAWGNRDGLKVNSGAMIIAPGSSFHAGNRHTNDIAPKAKMILMSGATFQTWKVRKKHSDLDVYGTLQAGMADRPLTKDAYLLLSPGADRFLGGRGLDVHPQGLLAVHSADPKKARLVFRIHPQAADGNGNLSSLVIALLGKLSLDGVEFNNFPRGGIKLADPGVRKEWKNVFYGKHNGGEPDELFATIQAPATRKRR